MKKVMSLFDYIYYRLNKVYYKWDGENGSTAAIGVSMVQSMILGDFILLLIKVIFTKEQIMIFSEKFVFFIGFTFICFVVYNYFFRYRNKLSYQNSCWTNETTKQREIRGILVVVSLIIPWILLIFITKI